MNSLYIVLVTLVFGFILFNMINNKRLSIFSSFLFLVFVLYYIIKKFDHEYYLEIVGDIKNIDLYSVIASGFGLVVASIEYYIGYKLYSKKHNVKMNPIEEVHNYKEVSSVENKDSLLVYLEMMEEPMGCLVNNQYLINNKMKKILKCSDYAIDRNTLYKYINSEDKNSVSSQNEINTFRLTVGDLEQWYEEVSVKLDGKDYRLIRQVSGNSKNKIKLKSFKDLNNQLKQLEREEKEYGLVFFDIANTADISAFYGKDFMDLVISKYLLNINNLPYILETKIFYVSSTEYVILFEDKIEYDILLSELENGNSEIIQSTIKVSGNKIIVKSKVGVVHSKNVSGGIQSVITKGFEMLKLASSIDYPADYAIYHEADENIDYSAKDLNIDLDIDLNKYKDKLR